MARYYWGTWESTLFIHCYYYYIICFYNKNFGLHFMQELCYINKVNYYHYYYYH